MSVFFNEIDAVDIIDKMSVGILILRRDLIVVAWNIRLEQWTGLKKSDIKNKDITLFYPHLKQSKYLNRIKDIFDGGPPIIFSSQFHKFFLPCSLPNGNLRVQHTTIIPVRTSGNEIYALIAIEDVTELTKLIQDVRKLHKDALREIEERKKIEKVLRQSESRINAIVNAAADAIITIKEMCIIQSANPAVEELFGYTPLELMGQNINKLIPGIYWIGQEGDSQSQPPESFPKIIGKGIEAQAIRKDGTVFPVELSISEVPLEDGVLYTSIIRDITERKRAEQEREKLIFSLRNALSNIRTLSGLLPICASCKKIRNDKGYWEQIESYVRDHSEVSFSHGICPDCFNTLYPDYKKNK